MSGRSARGQASARARIIDELTQALGERPFGDAGAFDMQRLDWFDLRNMLTVARAVTEAAALRTESRGAHQREDFPEMLPQWRVNQTIRLRGESLDITRTPAAPVEVAANERHRPLFLHRLRAFFLHLPARGGGRRPKVAGRGNARTLRMRQPLPTLPASGEEKKRGCP